MKYWIEKNLMIWQFRVELLAALLALLALPVTSLAQQPITSLEINAPIARAMKGGETHLFQIHLDAGQYFYAVLEQKGIDVVVGIFLSENKQVASIDSLNGNNGIEPIVIVAESGGDYRIEVKASGKQSGQYNIRIIALRLATPTDKEHAGAEKTFAEAEQLRSQRTANTWRAAIEKYQQILPFYAKSGNSERQALTLYMIGNCYANVGEFRQALIFLQQSLPQYRQLADIGMQGKVLNFIGGALDVLGDLPQALESYQQALVLARLTGNQSNEAAILNNIGKIYIDLADWQKGMDTYSNALSLYHSLDNKRLEANTLDNIGVAWYLQNDLEKALESHKKALALRQVAKDKSGEAATLQKIGLAYAAKGEMQLATEHYQLALPLHRATGDRNGEAYTLNYFGMALTAQGRYEQSLQALQQSLQLMKALEDKRGEGLALSNFGAAYAIMKQPQKALEYYNPALINFRAVLDPQNEAKTLQGIARAERELGNLEVARQRIETALPLYENVRTNINSQQSRASYFAVQQKAYEFYTDLLMQLHRQNPSAGHDAAALQITERARARSLLELLAESNVDFRQGVDAKLLDRERELMQQINAKAARLMQRNSADKIAELKKEISALEDDYQQAQTAIRKSNPQYANVTQPQPLSVPAIQKELDENTLLLEYALGEERSFVWAVTNNSLTSYELPKQSEIKPVAQQVYEALTARTLVVNVETPQTKQARIAQADAQFTEASAKLSLMLLAPLASQLGNKRLVIVADGVLQYVPFGALPECGLGIGDCGFLPSTATASIEKTATSRIVPQSAIRNPQSAIPLIVNHEIITLPSASTIAVMRRELAGRAIAPKMLAVIADPVFRSDDERAKISKLKLARIGTNEIAARGIVHTEEKSTGEQNMLGGLNIPRLPFTHQEADQIFAVAPKATSFKATDFNASRATVMNPDLKQYRFIHFATHGLLDSERPGLSALALSMIDEQGQPQDGFLRAHELYNLKLPAELVVLSACQTGLGKDIKGEGLVGLTRGFMYAGAARVIVSLWSVNDQATSELMTRLYHNMLKEGKSPAASLRAAQVAMWKQKQWSAPYYWAAFILQGEWR